MIPSQACPRTTQPTGLGEGAAPSASTWLRAVESREVGPHTGKRLTLFLLGFIQMLTLKPNHPGGLGPFFSELGLILCQVNYSLVMMSSHKWVDSSGS